MYTPHARSSSTYLPSSKYLLKRPLKHSRLHTLPLAEFHLHVAFQRLLVIACWCRLLLEEFRQCGRETRQSERRPGMRGGRHDTSENIFAPVACKCLGTCSHEHQVNGHFIGTPDWYWSVRLYWRQTAGIKAAISLLSRVWW